LDQTEKQALSTLDLLTATLREHEENLSRLIDRLENAVGLKFRVVKVLRYIDERLEVYTEDDRTGVSQEDMDCRRLLETFVNDLEHLKKVLSDEE